MARGSSVLVVETDRAAREAAHARFASEGATVRTCAKCRFPDARWIISDAGEKEHAAVTPRGQAPG